MCTDLLGNTGDLCGFLNSGICDFRFRIFNPDGREAEKSGNGLRIFSRYLWDQRLVQKTTFSVETLGGIVTCHVQNDGKTVSVEMGEVSFLSTRIPVTGDEREVL